MLLELHAASETLHLALDKYLTICNALMDSSICVSDFNFSKEISDHIARELDTVVSYGNKLDLAKSAIGMARNSHSSIVPISLLPDEIILRIFSLTLEKENSTFKTDVDTGRLPQQSLTMSQVCSRWRQIALGSQHLWSRINFSSYDQIAEQLEARGEIFAYRAKLLDIYFVEQFSESRVDAASAYRCLSEFFCNSGSRVRSVEIAFTKYCFGNHLPQVLFDCLIECIPAFPTRFILAFRADCPNFSRQASDCESDNGQDLDDLSGDAFLLPSDWDDANLIGEHKSFGIDIEATLLDDLLSSVTTAHLEARQVLPLLDKQGISWACRTSAC